MQEELDRRDGVLGLPLIRNEKRVDPTDSSSPEVIQIETAMGAAIELFDGATTIEVGRDRFVPVKTTSDLMVLRSDAYDMGKDFQLVQSVETLPTVRLGKHYKKITEFDKRFPAGMPSLREATSLSIEGDYAFGEGVKVVGTVVLHEQHGRVESGEVLTGESPA